MNYNRKRHKLLGELAEKLSSNDDPNNKQQEAYEVGMTFEQVDKFFNIKKNERNLILSELFDSNEIVRFESNKVGDGIFIDNAVGNSSFSDKKYIKINQDIFIKWLRNFVQIFIPIASLIITIIVLVKNPKDNYNKLDTEIQTIKQKVEHIEKVQNKKEQSPILEIHKTE